MKKAYINPKMEIVKFQTQQMILAGSTIGAGSGSQNAGNALSPEFILVDDVVEP